MATTCLSYLAQICIGTPGFTGPEEASALRTEALALISRRVGVAWSPSMWVILGNQGGIDDHTIVVGVAGTGCSSLSRAKEDKQDEFYTQLSDIERELKHYRKHFKNKVVYWNCDDPRVSNFFHYFSYNFEKLGLKKLPTTCYKNQSRDLLSRSDSEQASRTVVTSGVVVQHGMRCFGSAPAGQFVTLQL